MSIDIELATHVDYHDIWKYFCPYVHESEKMPIVFVHTVRHRKLDPPVMEHRIYGMPSRAT